MSEIRREMEKVDMERPKKVVIDIMGGEPLVYMLYEDNNEPVFTSIEYATILVEDFADSVAEIDDMAIGDNIMKVRSEIATVISEVMDEIDSKYDCDITRAVADCMRYLFSDFEELREISAKSTVALNNMLMSAMSEFLSDLRDGRVKKFSDVVSSKDSCDTQ